MELFQLPLALLSTKEGQIANRRQLRVRDEGPYL